MTEYYIIIYGIPKDPMTTWIGPMDSISTAQTLNEKLNCVGNIAAIDTTYSSLIASRIISPSDFRKGLSLEP